METACMLVYWLYSIHIAGSAPLCAYSYSLCHPRCMCSTYHIGHVCLHHSLHFRQSSLTWIREVGLRFWFYPFILLSLDTWHMDNHLLYCNMINDSTYSCNEQSCCLVKEVFSREKTYWCRVELTGPFVMLRLTSVSSSCSYFTTPCNFVLALA